MIKADKETSLRINQGDIFRNVDFIQKIEIHGTSVSIHKITFPLVIVLTQDCDLQQDSNYYKEDIKKPNNDDKKLLSVIVAPLYNEELFLAGEHLSDPSIDWKMQKINKKSKGKDSTRYKNLTDNEIPRYHHLKFEEEIPIVDSVIDFKHYFSVNVDDLIRIKERNYICKVSKLYRERVSQRFSNFLSRIGLPDPN
jgi:hypothetical protein